MASAKLRGATVATTRRPSGRRSKVAPKGASASHPASVQSRTVWSDEPVASQRPSDEGARQYTGPLWPA